MTTPPEEYERRSIKQTRGPTIQFRGCLIAWETWEIRGRREMEMTSEIWETPGGAYIAVSRSQPLDGQGIAETRAEVVEPSDDELAMQLAVMDFFDWDNRVRSMVRKQLPDWKLVVEVE